MFRIDDEHLVRLREQTVHPTRESGGDRGRKGRRDAIAAVLVRRTARTLKGDERGGAQHGDVWDGREPCGEHRVDASAGGDKSCIGARGQGRWTHAERAMNLVSRRRPELLDESAALPLD